MKSLPAALLLAAIPIAGSAQDWLDNFRVSLTNHTGSLRARLSGTMDLEFYQFEQPPPGLLFAEKTTLVNPRLTLYLDAQLGPSVYAFAQARVDRGFDPSDRSGADVRLDEYAVRFSPWADGRFSLQLGRFATVVGNWVQRHDSWDNPFVTAPVPYENLTAVWDVAAPANAGELLNWGHVPNAPGVFAADGTADKYLRLPVVWGPSYASGVSVAGRVGKLEYAAEMKNSPLASRPESWDVNEVGFAHPTFSARVGYRPNEAWNMGLSASRGSYLVREADPTLPAGRDRGDYHELVLAQDVSWAWHHWQIWAECYEARFEVPNVGDADTLAYYVEAKYKFTPQLFGALRWNQQFFDNIADGAGGHRPWGNDYWRIDSALGYRLTPQAQLKLQYSLDHSDSPLEKLGHLFAGQLTVRF